MNILKINPFFPANQSERGQMGVMIDLDWVEQKNDGKKKKTI